MGKKSRKKSLKKIEANNELAEQRQAASPSDDNEDIQYFDIKLLRFDTSDKAVDVANSWSRLVMVVILIVNVYTYIYITGNVLPDTVNKIFLWFSAKNIVRISSLAAAVSGILLSFDVFYSTEKLQRIDIILHDTVNNFIGKFTNSVKVSLLISIRKPEDIMYWGMNSLSVCIPLYAAYLLNAGAPQERIDSIYLGAIIASSLGGLLILIGTMLYNAGFRSITSFLILLVMVFPADILPIIMQNDIEMIKKMIIYVLLFYYVHELYRRYAMGKSLQGCVGSWVALLLLGAPYLTVKAFSYFMAYTLSFPAYALVRFALYLRVTSTVRFAGLVATITFGIIAFIAST